MKLIKDKSRRVYELTYLTPASLTETELTAIREEVARLAKKHKGEAQAAQNWGKKPLAYTIHSNGKSYDEAVYTHQLIEMESESAPAFEKEIYLNESIIRHLLVVAEKANAKADQKPTPEVEEKTEKLEAAA